MLGEFDEPGSAVGRVCGLTCEFECVTKGYRFQGWRGQSTAVWVMVLVLGFFIAFASLSSSISSQGRLAKWRVPEAQVHWIAPRPSLLPRHPTEGETIYSLKSLPFGDPSAVQLYYRFKSNSPNDAPQAILLPAVDGQVQAFVNFTPIRETPLALAPGLLTSTARSRLWLIPWDHIHRDENRIDIIVKGTTLRALAAAIYLGPKADLEPATSRGIQAITAARLLVLLASLLACIVNLGAFMVRAPVRHLPIAAALAAYAARTFLADTRDPVGILWPAVDPLLLAAIAICSGLALHDAGSASRRIRGIGMGLLLAAGISGAIVLLASWKGLGMISAWGGVLSAMLGIAYLLLALLGTAPNILAQSARVQILAGGLAGLGLAAAVFSVVGVAGLTAPFTPFGWEISFTVALVTLALLAVGYGLIEGVRALRIRLDYVQTIRRQRAELEATAFALEEKTRQSAVLEERQRMARDVHDGIGGQLASLIAQVRMRRISMDNVERALVGGLSELRLLVNSLDAVGETLTDALALFHDKARQQVEAAGMSLNWNQADLLAVETRDAQWIMNLYRLMQEAITNAVRHSGGDLISVTINHPGRRKIVIRIEDNGGGIDMASVKRGRGLTNMEHRARDMGATFKIATTEIGLGLAILVEAPLPR